MTARSSGADSGNDDDEEDGGLGLRWSPSGVHGQRIGMKSPTTVEYSYFSDGQFCLHFLHINDINMRKIQSAC